MCEEFEPLERDNDNSDIVDLLKSKKSYLMQRFVKFSYDKRRETRKKCQMEHVNLGLKNQRMRYGIVSIELMR